MGGIALVLALASTPVAADAVHTHDDDISSVPEALRPERWSTGAAVGLDRSGDIRPEANAILDAIEAADAPLTIDEIAGVDRAEGSIAHVTMPATIRVWRRGLDG